jgi:hypothetical protein
VQVFAAMLDNPQRVEAQTGRVRIEGGIRPVVFRQLLRFLYNGGLFHAGISELSEGLFDAAHKYRLPKLRVCCLLYLFTIFLPNLISIEVIRHLFQQKYSNLTF